MIVSEEKARASICPHIRICPNELDVIHHGAVARYEHQNCQGSDCTMAWRRVRLVGDRDGADASGGYCGIAGKPNGAP